MIGLAAVVEAVLAGRGIYGHAADGVAHGRRIVSVVAMAGMIVAGVACDRRSRRLAGSAFPVLPLASCMTSPALESDTLWGYIGLMRKDIKASCQKRLSRIEGQVRGLSKMVDEDRYCIDIVTQISAVRAALRRVEEEVLRDHVSHCVEHAITSGNKADQREKIAELMAVIGRSDR